MGPQLYISMYKEQFRSPGRVKRTELRPTSAHRRNNPQPRPDFLFPHSLQSNYRPSHAISHLLPPVDTGRPLFPPVRHFSSHNPVKTCTENAGKPQHMPAVNGSTAQDLPSADRKQKLQLTEFPARTDIRPHTAVRNPPKTKDNQRNASPLSALQLIKQAGAHLRSRPQTSTPSADAHRFHRPQYRRCCSNSTLDYSSGCYSCFQVVRPYQAGHYIIHPEFVSESLY